VSRWETGHAEPTGTAAAILSDLITGITRREELGPVVPLASGVAFYRVLKSHFEEDVEKKA
jgi:hypothetical protein